MMVKSMFYIFHGPRLCCLVREAVQFKVNHEILLNTLFQTNELYLQEIHLLFVPFLWNRDKPIQSFSQVGFP